MDKQNDRPGETVQTAVTTAITQETHTAIQDTQQRLIDEFTTYCPDGDALTDKFTAAAVNFAHICARYLSGDCAINVAQQGWEGYASAVKTLLLGGSPFPGYPLPPEMLARFGQALTDEAAHLDTFSRRVLDLCVLTGTHLGSFLWHIETRGPVAAAYTHLRATGMDEATALGALLHTTSHFHLRLTLGEDDRPTGDEPTASPSPPNALGRFLLTLIPERLPLIVQLLTRTDRAPHYFKQGLPMLVKLLASDPAYLPLAWQIAREASPLLVGACAGALLLVAPDNMDADLCAQSRLVMGTRDQRLAACQALIDAECGVADDLLMMRDFLRHSFAVNPLDHAITAWLSHSMPLVWWAPLLSAMADEQVLSLMGKGTSVAFWRELGRQARRRNARVQLGPGGPSRALTRSAFLWAWHHEAQQAFARAGAPFGLSAGELYEMLAQRRGAQA